MAGIKLADKINSKDITLKVNLTNAEIKALRATPKTLVASPKEGRLNFVGARLVLKYGGTNVFTETADNLAIRYTDGSGAKVSDDIECTGFIDQSANTETNARAKADAIVASENAIGKALVLHNIGDGEFGGNAGNDNTMEVYITFQVIR